MKKQFIIGIVVILILVILILVGIYAFKDSSTTVPVNSETNIVCDSDSYNYNDFDSQISAQEIYDFCSSSEIRDIHGLDNYGDGIVCEGLG